jgi:hypothetical protein
MATSGHLGGYLAMLVESRKPADSHSISEKPTHRLEKVYERRSRPEIVK